MEAAAGTSVENALALEIFREGQVQEILDPGEADPSEVALREPVACEVPRAWVEADSIVAGVASLVELVAE